MAPGVRARRARFLLTLCPAVLLLAAPFVITSADEPDPGSGPAGVAAGMSSSPVEVVDGGRTTTPMPGVARAAVAAADASAADAIEVGIAVLDRATGELAVSGRGREPFYAASLAKLVVAVDVLDRRRFDGLVVADSDLALLRRALSSSDDDAMNALWSRFDGAGAAARVSHRLHLPATSGPRNPSQWGEMEISAADYVRLWHYVLVELPPADRDLLVSDMDAAHPVAADGFDQAFGLLSLAVDGPGAVGAVAKQGWMCCLAEQYYLHSGGVVGPDRRFMVTLMSRQPRSVGWAAARQELDQIASAAVQALS